LRSKYAGLWLPGVGVDRKGTNDEGAVHSTHHTARLGLTPDRNFETFIIIHLH